MLYPLNKYLVVEPIEAPQENQSTVLIPEGAYEERPVYKLVKLLEPHADSKLRPGMHLLVPTHLLENITVANEKHYLIPEGHVMAFYEERNE